MKDLRLTIAPHSLTPEEHRWLLENPQRCLECGHLTIAHNDGYCQGPDCGAEQGYHRGWLGR